MRSKTNLKAEQSRRTILFIDTSDNKKVVIALKIDGRKKEKIRKTNNWTSQVLLPLINELLKENKTSFQKLSQIKVNPGPGSFTGIRVGVAVANALSWLLDIPVNVKKDRFVEPIYG